ncbi:hypothetical protein HDV05_001159, partial [Chytridiales sp. JEL 0842]
MTTTDTEELDVYLDQISGYSEDLREWRLTLRSLKEFWDEHGTHYTEVWDSMTTDNRRLWIQAIYPSMAASPYKSESDRNAAYLSSQELVFKFAPELMVTALENISTAPKLYLQPSHKVKNPAEGGRSLPNLTGLIEKVSKSTLDSLLHDSLLCAQWRLGTGMLRREDPNNDIAVMLRHTILHDKHMSFGVELPPRHLLNQEFAKDVQVLMERGIMCTPQEFKL